MTAFAKTFDDTVPQGSALANTLDTVIQDFKTGVNERIKVEHHDLENALTIQDKYAPGRARAGLLGTVAKVTGTQRDTIKGTRATPGAIYDGYTAWGPGDGALVWNTSSNILQRYNATSDDWENLTSVGVTGDTVTQPNLGVQATYLANFSTTLQNTSGRPLGINLLSIIGDPTAGIGYVQDYAFGFLIFISSTTPVTSANIIPGGLFVRRLDQTAPDNFLGSCSAIVPQNWYYFIKSYAYVKTTAWTFYEDSASFWTFAVGGGRMSTLQLILTYL